MINHQETTLIICVLCEIAQFLDNKHNAWHTVSLKLCFLDALLKRSCHGFSIDTVYLLSLRFSYRMTRRCTTYTALTSGSLLNHVLYCTICLFHDVLDNLLLSQESLRHTATTFIFNFSECWPLFFSVTLHTKNPH